MLLLCIYFHKRTLHFPVDFPSLSHTTHTSTFFCIDFFLYLSNLSVINVEKIFDRNFFKAASKSVILYASSSGIFNFLAVFVGGKGFIAQVGEENLGFAALTILTPFSWFGVDSPRSERKHSSNIWSFDSRLESESWDRSRAEFGVQCWYSFSSRTLQVILVYFQCCTPKSWWFFVRLRDHVAVFACFYLFI